jgi:hypothetical protein
MKRKKRGDPAYISGNPFDPPTYESWWSRNQGTQAANWDIGSLWLKRVGMQQRGICSAPSFLACVTCSNTTPPGPTSRISCGRAQQFPLVADSIIVRYVAEAARERWQECVRESHGRLGYQQDHGSARVCHLPQECSLCLASAIAQWAYPLLSISLSRYQRHSTQQGCEKELAATINNGEIPGPSCTLSMLALGTVNPSLHHPEFPRRQIFQFR